MHDSYDQVIFTWGKHSGQTLGTVIRTDPTYLQWMINTPSLPTPWIEAAKRAINGEDISDIKLPRTKMAAVPKQVKVDNSPIFVHLKNSKTAYLIMPYNKLLLEKFKYEIDGRKWNGEEKHWEFPAVHLPKLKKTFPEANFSPDTQKLMDKLTERREDLDEIRELEDTDFHIEGLKLDLYPYQRVGVRFVDRADGRCLIADAPGLVRRCKQSHMHKSITLKR